MGVREQQKCGRGGEVSCSDATACCVWDTASLPLPRPPSHPPTLPQELGGMKPTVDDNLCFSTVTHVLRQYI
jgi:hypothetical protein